jgi:hypothetical protein
MYYFSCKCTCTCIFLSKGFPTFIQKHLPHSQYWHPGIHRLLAPRAISVASLLFSPFPTPKLLTIRHLLVCLALANLATFMSLSSATHPSLTNLYREKTSHSSVSTKPIKRSWCKYSKLYIFYPAARTWPLIQNQHPIIWHKFQR